MVRRHFSTCVIPVKAGTQTVFFRPHFFEGKIVMRCKACDKETKNIEYCDACMNYIEIDRIHHAKESENALNKARSCISDSFYLDFKEVIGKNWVPGKWTPIVGDIVAWKEDIWPNAGYRGLVCSMINRTGGMLQLKVINLRQIFLEPRSKEVKNIAVGDLIKRKSNTLNRGYHRIVWEDEDQRSLQQEIEWKKY